MLFAAGLGTRLKPFTDNHPKALAVVNGRTLLEHNIRYLQEFGIKDVVINVHHFADQIMDMLTENNGFGSRILMSNEADEVLETGGGLKKAIPLFIENENVLVMNVDVITNLKLDKLLAAHEAGTQMATLAVMDRHSTRGFLFNKELQLCGWRNNSTAQEKISRNENELRMLAFSGVQVLRPSFLQAITEEGKFSLVEVYLRLASSQSIRGHNHTGDIFLDVGKPESLQMADKLLNKRA